MGTFTNSEDPDEMLHNATFIRVYTVCIGKKKVFRQNNTIYFFLNNNPTPLDMYNELFHVYCIKPEGRIHLYTKGKILLAILMKKFLLYLLP